MTGAPAGRWYWHCPQLSVDLTTSGHIGRVEWRGGGSHDYGDGRPRWHVREPRQTEGGADNLALQASLHDAAHRRGDHQGMFVANCPSCDPSDV